MENNRKLLASILENYNLYKEQKLQGRYITQTQISPVLNSHQDNYRIDQIGVSVNNLPIHKIVLGNGSIKILVWSQMHGNESTTTKAIFDLLNFLKLRDDTYTQTITKHLEIHIIPILNPDGARAYTRVNANFIDLNRDAQELSQLESKILRTQFDHIDPAFCFNLHDQRSIYSAGETSHPATISFLTPSMDEARSVTDSRKESMQVIAAINNEMQRFIPHQVGRYDDSFNLNCTGDTFQNRDVPTILFEAGHFQDDYTRDETRKFVFLALIAGLYSIAEKTYKKINFLDYARIPQNAKMFLDIILRNAKVNGHIVDIGIQFNEEIEHGKVVFIPAIQKIKRQLDLLGHKEINCDYKILQINGNSGFDENVIVDNLHLNDEVLQIKPR